MAAVEEFLAEAAKGDSIYDTTSKTLDSTDKYHQGFHERQQQCIY
jgi:hypothetical protein